MDHKPDDILRLFYGVLLPPEVQQEVAALQQRLAASGVRIKWVEPENLHVTLKFLGELPALALRDLKLVGHKLAADLSPWEVQLQGLGAFPKLSRPQSLWVGVGPGLEPFTHLGKRLNEKLEQEMIAGGDTKPFHPHCTIGRVKQPHGLRELTELVQKELDFAPQAFRCDHFQLMCSKLAASGPTYEVLAEFGLGTRG
ncbi:MAG: RNA 2',3'-cyclic phosphodiesterase [Armatimonadetes bacterium]|nr:RNA 2',3'-cyclic phosphodiesterase [Armatimonadota bacterium]